MRTVRSFFWVGSMVLLVGVVGVIPLVDVAKADEPGGSSTADDGSDYHFNNAGTPNTATTSTTTASCSGGGRSGKCLAACQAVGDLIAPATGCAQTEFCCVVAAEVTGSNTGTGGASNITLPNPLGFTSVEAFLTNGILNWLRGVAVTLALVFFVLGALIYMTGGVDDGALKKGRATMTAALIGLALALAAPTFLKEIYSILGVSGGPAGLSLVQISLNVLKFFLSIIGILATIMLVVSGLTFMSSAGSDDQIKSAKKMANAAVIGLALAMASLILVRQVTKLFL